MMIRGLLPLLMLVMAGGGQEARRLIPGDTVEIRCAESARYCLRRNLSRTGTVTLPGLAPVALVRLSAPEAADRISEVLARTGMLANATVDVRIVPSQRSTAVLSGLLATPGEYAVGPETTLQELLAEAGADGDADLTRVAVETTEGRVMVNAKARPWQVRPGDRIEIYRMAARQEAFVLGGVERPGAVEISEGMTVAEAIERAGGVGSHGSMDGWVLRRKGEATRKLDLQAAASVRLKVGDTVEVPLASERRFVAVTGAVNRPGSVPFRTNMKLTEALAAAGGAAVGGDVTRIEIRSLGGKATRVDLVAIRGGKQADPILKFGDAVIVPRGRE